MSAMINKNWNDLIKPTKVESNGGVIVVEPLERGFGMTLGNALRRILLSSLQGAAVTSIKIDGVVHEFSSIPGVKEDITDIVLNIKSLVIKAHSADRKRVTLNVVGPCEVTAGMIECGSDLEIVNKDL